MLKISTIQEALNQADDRFHRHLLTILRQIANHPQPITFTNLIVKNIAILSPSEIEELLTVLIKEGLITCQLSKIGNHIFSLTDVGRQVVKVNFRPSKGGRGHKKRGR